MNATATTSRRVAWLRRHARSVLWLAAGALLHAAWTHAPWAPFVAGSAGVEEALVSRAIDGDTIELADGERVRYIGIDTPELYRRSGSEWVYRPQPHAEQAWTFNQRAVEGRTVRLESDVERRDRFQRRLAYVYRDGRLVNADLVEQGLASAITIPPNTQHADLFRRLEREARDAGRGLWATEGASP